MVPSLASENIPSDRTGDRSRDLPTSSAVPWPLRYPRPHIYVIFLLILLKMRNTLDKSRRENQNTIYFRYFSRKDAVCKIMWQDTKSIVAFLLRQWLRERAKIFRYTCIHPPTHPPVRSSIYSSIHPYIHPSSLFVFIAAIHSEFLIFIIGVTVLRKMNSNIKTTPTVYSLCFSECFVFNLKTSSWKLYCKEARPWILSLCVLQHLRLSGTSHRMELA
jgi:hypothetical protein